MNCATSSPTATPIRWISPACAWSCLTGENGAGKSSLLDAITWALGGHARARRDDELIAQGETEARVSLTFSEGEQTFQVVRTRKVGRATQKGRAPTTSGSLDFFIEDSGSWRALTEPRVAETQARIERLLNLSYETFFNSAYLKQMWSCRIPAAPTE